MITRKTTAQKAVKFEWDKGVTFEIAPMDDSLRTEVVEIATESQGKKRPRLSKAGFREYKQTMQGLSGKAAVRVAEFMIRNCVVGWDGVTAAHLAGIDAENADDMVPPLLDTSQFVFMTGTKKDSPWKFTPENLETLAEIPSGDFSQFFNAALNELSGQIADERRAELAKN